VPVAVAPPEPSPPLLPVLVLPAPVPPAPEPPAPVPPPPLPVVVPAAPPVPEPLLFSQAPLLQAPPGHGDPSALSGFEHRPVCASQVPASWQASSAVHPSGMPVVHTPAWQAPAAVHGSPSSQVEPSGFAGSEHWPDAGLQTPSSWHAPEALHTIGLLPVQMPFWHVSVRVQLSPSLHAVPVKPAHVPLEGAPAAVEQAVQSDGSPLPQAVSQQTPSMQ
jgi:hypothetical protein